MGAYGGADGEVAAEAHARAADEAGAGGQAEEDVDCPAGVLIVGFEGLFRCGMSLRSTRGRRGKMDQELGSHLLDLPGVARIGARHIVGQGLGTGEFVVRRRGRDDVALSSDLASESGDGAGHCFYSN